MAASHVPAVLDFRTWLPAMCALSRSSASSCQQLAGSPQKAPRVLTEERKDALMGKLPLFFGIRFGLIT
jgi:hypothetical protein